MPSRLARHSVTMMGFLLTLLVSTLAFGQQLTGRDVVTDTMAALQLPEPLTIHAALASVAKQPELIRARARIRRARADQFQAETPTDLRVNLEGRLEWIDANPLATDRRRNDSSIGIVARKQLYDFGRASSTQEAAQLRYQKAELSFIAETHRQSLGVLSAYLDVIEADLESAWRREGMSIAFIRFDRLKDRLALGQISDVELLESEATYQEWREKLYGAESQQRITRAFLANSMNQPEHLPSDLIPPPLLGVKNLPELDALEKTVLLGNPSLKAARKRVAAWQADKRAARVAGAPTLNFEANLNEYHRKTSGRERWSLGLVFDWPLLDGSTTNAAIGTAEAGYLEALANRQQTELALRLELRQSREAILVANAMIEAANVRLDSRDLLLDRSRALYELEVRADLGDAMVAWSEARLKQARAQHAKLKAEARLLALQGQPVTNLFVNGTGTLSSDIGGELGDIQNENTQK